MHGGRIWHQNHVGFVDSLPAADRRAVEHDAIGEHVFVDTANVHRQVMQLALGVGEAQINELDVVILDLLEDIICSRHFLSVPLLR